MLPKITRDDLGQPAAAGEYEFRGMSVHVDPQHLRAWNDDPTTAFSTILCTRVGDDVVRLTLGVAIA